MNAMVMGLPSWQLTVQAPLAGRDRVLCDDEAIAIWSDLAQGHWQVLGAVDVNGRRHVAIAKASRERSIDWNLLTERERQVLDFLAQGTAQKVIALTLGMAPSTVSSAACSARDKLGLDNVHQLVRAYFGVQGSVAGPG
jgi:DNA-binding NarL/FixJ family response regulator